MLIEKKLILLHVNNNKSSESEFIVTVNRFSDPVHHEVQNSDNKVTALFQPPSRIYYQVNLFNHSSKGDYASLKREEK